MIEARLECKCGRIALPDLDLVLTKGQTCYLDAAKARGSKDLQRAWHVKAVSLKYVERIQHRRAAPVTATHPMMPRGMVAAPEPEPAARELLLVDPGDIAVRVAEELDVESIVSKQLEAVEDRVVARVTAAVVAALGSLPVAPMRMAASSQAHPVGRVPVSGDVPVYVPSKIGDDGLQADLGLEPNRAQEGAVSDAAAALRLAREAGKERRTEKPE